MTSYPTIGLFGGTFDPVHCGHLRMALELKQHLQLDEMRLIPCQVPPHRTAPVAAAVHRAAMVEQALGKRPELQLDRLELDCFDPDKPEPSYSVNTLIRLRRQLGEHVSLCLAMGMDSLISLPGWHQWRRLLELAHIVVAARPDWALPEHGELSDTVRAHMANPAALAQESRGRIVICELSLLPISSTAIRGQLARGESPRYLLPDAVLDYIHRHHLYPTPGPKKVVSA